MELGRYFGRCIGDISGYIDVFVNRLYNLVLNRFDQAPFARGWIRNLEEVASNGEALVEKFDIRAPNAYLSAGSLSGGNKQKVVVARELSQRLDVVIAAQPTRGVDVGSIEFIHNQLIFVNLY